MLKNNILGVILAGGKSKRFGDDKSIAKLGDKTLLDHSIEKIEKDFQEILIVTNKDTIISSKKNIFSTKDLIDGHLGPLVGVLSAMAWAQENKKKYDWVATFPCDTPFFDINLTNKLKLKTNNTSKKLIFLNSKKKRHNIFGVWSIDLIEILENDLKKNFRKVEIWADKIGYESININIEKFDKFLNINTKKDFEKAKKNINKI